MEISFTFDGKIARKIKAISVRKFITSEKINPHSSIFQSLFHIDRENISSSLDREISIDLSDHSILRIGEYEVRDKKSRYYFTYLPLSDIFYVWFYSNIDCRSIHIIKAKLSFLKRNRLINELLHLNLRNKSITTNNHYLDMNAYITSSVALNLRVRCLWCLEPPRQESRRYILIDNPKKFLEIEFENDKIFARMSHRECFISETYDISKCDEIIQRILDEVQKEYIIPHLSLKKENDVVSSFSGKGDYFSFIMKNIILKAK